LVTKTEFLAAKKHFLPGYSWNIHPFPRTQGPLEHRKLSWNPEHDGTCSDTKKDFLDSTVDGQNSGPTTSGWYQIQVSIYVAANIFLIKALLSP